MEIAKMFVNFNEKEVKLYNIKKLRLYEFFVKLNFSNEKNVNKRGKFEHFCVNINSLSNQF